MTTYTNWDVQIGERLRQIRLEMGWSQERMAEEIGVTALSVSKFENGRRWPRISTLERIARVTGYPLGFLCDGCRAAQSFPLLIWRVDFQLRLTMFVGSLAREIGLDRSTSLGQPVWGLPFLSEVAQPLAEAAAGRRHSLLVWHAGRELVVRLEALAKSEASGLAVELAPSTTQQLCRQPHPTCAERFLDLSEQVASLRRRV